MLFRRYFLMTGDTGRWYSTKTFQCFRYSKNGPDHSSSACPQTVGRVKWRKNLCITFRLVLYSFIVIWTSAAMTVVLVDTGLLLQTDAAWRWLCHDYIEPQASCSNTVESSLFGGDQCLWHLWVTLANELTSPRTYTQLFVKYLLKLSRLQNYGRVNFGYPRTLTLTNKNDFTVVVNIRLNVCTYV